MLIDAISAGIQAALVRQRVSAVNIANQLSEGFTAYRVTQREGEPGAGPLVEVARTDAPVDLVSEIVTQITTEQEVSLYAAVIGRQERALGSLLDVLA